MTNRAAWHRANHPGRPVVDRTKNAIAFDYGGGVVERIITIAPLHRGSGPFTQAHEIDTTWVTNSDPAQAQYEYMQTTGDGYRVYALSNPAGEFDSAAIIKAVHEASGEELTFTAQQLQWVNDLDQISAIATPTKAVGSVSDYQVNFPAAFGTGLDFVWMNTATAIRKELIVQTAGAIGTPPQFIIDGGNPQLRMQFIFTVSAAVNVWVDGVQWNKSDKLVTASRIEFRDTGGSILWWFGVPVAEDAAKESFRGTMSVERQGPNFFVRVRIPWAWLQTATFPVRIDPPVSYYAGAGDGSIYTQLTTWDATHDATDGAGAEPTVATAFNGSRRYTSVLYAIWRGFFPVDTSSIPDGDTISAATLYVYASDRFDDINDAYDYYILVQTSQASTSTLGVADFDQCGAVNNPTPGSSQFDANSITISAYNAWPLNATGLTWIDKAGVTKLGMREGHDAEDYEVLSDYVVRWTANFSEQTGTAQDPYLEVTHAAADINLDYGSDNLAQWKQGVKISY